MMPVPNRILLALDPVDFRKQIDCLAAVCESRLEEEPLDGTLFLFGNKRKNGLKALMWTSGGFTMAYKKLEQGRFPWPSGEGDKVQMTRAELAALLEGLDVSSAPRLSRWNPVNQRDDTPRMHRWMLWGGLLAMSSVAYAEEAGSTPEAPAKVCIRRAVGMSGWAVPLVLRQGDEVLEDFAVNEQRCFDVDPGTQAFEATYWATVRKMDRPNAKAALELSPGDCRYLKVDFGFWGVRLEDTDNRGFGEAARCDVRGRRRLRR